MEDQDVILEATRLVRAYTRAVAELRPQPRFGGDEAAQRFWLGRTDAERIADVERQIALGEAAISDIRARLAA